MMAHAKVMILVSTLFACLTTVACSHNNDTPLPRPASAGKGEHMSDTVQVATLGGGCFWCIEAVYQRLDGVLTVESGYAGGKTVNPTYKDVCSGTTGHAEVCKVTFDPRRCSYADVLQVFFGAHDPTTLNRQGNDAGTQYRSVIFTHSDEQEKEAKAYIAQLTEAHTWPNPIVTQVLPAPVFYKAEDYHQNYFNENGEQPYCSFVVRPKVEKFMKQFKDRVSPAYK